MVEVIDPLLLKLSELVRQGRPHALTLARLRYGSPQDLLILEAEVKRVADERESSVVIDFTPMARIGRPEVLRDFVRNLGTGAFATYLATEGELSESLMRAGAVAGGQVLTYRRDGSLKSTESPKAAPAGARAFALEARELRTLAAVRRAIAHRRLLNLLTLHGVVYPHAPEVPRQRITWVDGRPFIVMDSRMLVSCYLHVKRALLRPQHLMAAAYEVCLALNHYFAPSPDSDSAYDIIVVPNNTALYIASALQLMTGGPISVIDKLGPIPSRRLTQINASISVADQRVVLLEEVTATGGELDRAIMYLTAARARIVQIVSCFDLEVGRPLLKAHVPFVSLCTPKRALGYVYRSN